MSAAGIKQLLEAENTAKQIIEQGKQDRKAKLQKANQDAEAELDRYKKEKEREYEAEKAKKEVESKGADRSSADEEEMRRVTQDFENNKGECIKYIVQKVLEVPIGLTTTQAQALKTGAV